MIAGDAWRCNVHTHYIYTYMLYIHTYIHNINTLEQYIYIYILYTHACIHTDIQTYILVQTPKLVCMHMCLGLVDGFDFGEKWRNIGIFHNKYNTKIHSTGQT